MNSPIKLTHITPNHTSLTIGDAELHFSYATPIFLYIAPAPAREAVSYTNTTFYSNTSSRHLQAAQDEYPHVPSIHVAADTFFRNLPHLLAPHWPKSP